MEHAEKHMPWISEQLTWAEICDRYPNQELCLVEVDYVHPNGPAVRTGRVIGHGNTIEEAMDQAEFWREHYDEISLDSTRPIIFRYPRPQLVLDDETRDAIFGTRR